MGKTAGLILKSDDVKFEGQFHLDFEQADSGIEQKVCATPAVPQVRILENHPDYAVIEVTCSCGNKTCLRCEYNAAEAADDTQT